MQILGVFCHSFISSAAFHAPSLPCIIAVADVVAAPLVPPERGEEDTPVVEALSKDENKRRRVRI